MPNFEFEKKIESLEIKRELLERIENYIIEDVARITGLTQEIIKQKYKISIVDDLGVEEFNSINEFNLILFSNFTKSINVRMRIYRPKELTISIRFNVDKSTSNISIQFEDNNAREKVKSIYEGIKRILDSYKTTNYLFHPRDFISMVLFLSGLFLFLGGVQLSFSEKVQLPNICAFIMFTIVIIVVIYGTIGGRIHPYMLFESQKSSKYKKWNDWFLRGLIGFIIFQIIFGLLLKYIFELPFI